MSLSISEFKADIGRVRSKDWPAKLVLGSLGRPDHDRRGSEEPQKPRRDRPLLPFSERESRTFRGSTPAWYLAESPKHLQIRQAKTAQVEARVLLIICGLVANIAAPGLAFAQDDRVATARELAIDGIDHIEAGSCTKGVPLVERAEGLHHGVVHLQYLARCDEKRGNLVAATEKWRRILLEPIASTATPAVHRAVAEARERLAIVLPKLARTTVQIDRVRPGLRIELDGRTLAPELFNMPQVLDPGSHRLVARAPSFEPFAAEWTLEDGGSATIAVVLEPQAAATPASDGTRFHGDVAGHSNSMPWTTLGWVQASAGSAALVAGVVTWVMRDGKRRDLRKRCPNGACPVSAFDDAKELESEKSAISDLTTASNVLGIGGGLLVASGITFIILGSQSTDSESTDEAPGFVKIDVGPQNIRATACF